MPHIDTAIDGWTELRVHGVANSDPRLLLGHPSVERVAGDDRAGFYRRKWDSAVVSADGPAHRMEAYSWRGLTVGDWARVLWLLLFPLMMLNIAFHMAPVSPIGETAAWRRVRACGESAQRILALTMTVTLVLALAIAAMDILGWQCGQTGTICSKQDWLAFTDSWWMQGSGRRLAVSALLPIGGVTLLWKMSRDSARMTEDMPPPLAPSSGGQRTPLEDRAFWNGGNTVARMRHLHIATGYSVIGLFLATPLQASSQSGRALGSALMLCFLATIGISAILIALPSVGRRERTSGLSGVSRGPQRAVAGAAILLLVVVWTATAGSDDLNQGPTTELIVGGLPWAAPAMLALPSLQFALLVCLAGVCGVVARYHPGRRPPERQPAPGGSFIRIPSPAPICGGLGTLVFAGSAWALSTTLTAAAVIRLADIMGQPQSAPRVGDSARPPLRETISLPVEYLWAASTAIPALASVVAPAFFLVAFRLRRRARQLTGQVAAEYSAVLPPGEPDPSSPRTVQIAAIWARAMMMGSVRAVVGLVAILGAVLTMGAVMARLARPGIADSRLLQTGAALTGFGLVWLGLRVFRRAGLADTIGTLWDLGAFWPRAVHPLGPPCYAERAVPDLLHRIEYICGHGGRVLLSCHSQGSVIGAATVAALSDHAASRTALLTYGSPLGSLYTYFFPAYFGLDELARLGTLLLADANSGSDNSADTRETWPWINLYRRSDSLGGPIFTSQAAFIPGRERPCSVDWQLLDPMYQRLPGDTVDPPALGHHAYETDPAFPIAIAEARRRRESPPAGNPAVPDDSPHD